MKVYLVFKNADFTEGRGPMIFDSIYEDGEDAIKYVKSQPGIYGSKQYVERDKYGYFAYGNGYDVREEEVRAKGYNDELMQKERKKQKALAKLTAEEKELLGL